MLLPARELATAIFAAFFEARKNAVHVFELPGRTFALSEQKVFLHRQQLENAAVLRHQAQAEFGNGMRRQALNGLAAKTYAPLCEWHHADYDFQRGGLAGAIAPQQRDQFAVVDLQGHALQHMALAVVRMAVFNFQNHALPPVIMLPR